MGILVVVAAGCYTFGNHRTKAVSPRGLAEAYFFSPLKKKRPPGLLSSHVPEQIKTLTSFWGHHGWLGMQPSLLWAAASRDPPARQSRRTRSHPPLQSASEGIGGARGLGNLVRPESHPEPRGSPVQWADPVVNPASKPSVRPRLRTRVDTGRSGCSHRSTSRLYPSNVCRNMCVP